ncbi:beta-ketoacyl synthase N-terminal-like domain-containing protein, partial [Streptomyces boncukensis]
TPTAPAEPIAIIGVSGRYPGADDLWQLWENLCSGRRAVPEPAPERDAPDAEADAPRWGTYLSDVDRFDPLLFRISPRDAERMDPQERLFLEAAWSAAEDAGYPPRGLERRIRRQSGDGAAGVGVFAGVADTPYQALAAGRWAAGQRASVHPGQGSVAHRVSHCLGLTGPSLTTDTACSSALTALHLACEAIRRGDCGAAVAGGVSVILHPAHHHARAAAHLLSRDGRARAFDQDADGMVTGEGVGAVVLKPLERALADGDRVHGVLLGTFVNANGPSPGYAAPRAGAQEDLLEGALRRAGIDGSALHYVEAHASGSPVADPVEVAALTRVLERASAGPGGCAIGSVKPELGHLEAASGMAQLAKVLLQLRHAEFAPTSAGDRPVPGLDGAGTPLRLVRARTPWPAEGPAGQGGPRIAGISSFGAGGANAHALVAQAPDPGPRTPEPDGPHLVVVSARRPEQLAEHARRLRDFVRSAGAGLPLGDVAYTLQTGREELAARLATAVRDLPELADRLDRFLAGDGEDAVVTAVARRTEPQQHAAVPDRADPGALLELGRAWAQGAHVDWARLHSGRDRRVVSLPGYAFARQRCWLPAPPAAPDSEHSEHREHTDLRDGKVGMGSEGNHDTHTSAGALEAVRAALVTAVADILGVPGDEVDMECHLSDFGFDSLSIVALSERLERTLSVTVSPAELYGYARVAGLVTDLARRVPSADPPQRRTEPEPEPGPEPQQKRKPAAVGASGAPDPAECGQPVAVVGMAGAFPGSPDLEAFWSNLVAGRDLISEIPADRFDWRTAATGPEGGAEPLACRWGGFLDDIDRFDAAFFGISPREARLMDPQHRLLLQTVWHVVEDAGHDPRSLAGTATGLFIGVASSDYARLAHRAGLPADGQLATGNDHAMLVNRVSFQLDLHGPSEPVHTACSSSLTAVHRAVRAIREGECEQAVAGGVNLMLTPDAFAAFSSAGMLAGDGRCKAFDHRADGYVRGEGIGAVLLKPLERARADGDHIHALIRGSAVNHGGRSASLTAPNPTAQADVIVQAHRRAGTAPETVGYIETHGTGTALGDPIEFTGLTSAFAQLGDGAGARRCGLGSVKSNIGHLETAAGIAGLLKVLLALRHGMLPPTLHVERANPGLEFSGTPFHLVDEARPWERPRDRDGAPGPRRAGVSSFGFGGVNAHVVVEEAVPTGAGAAPEDTGGRQVFVLSAHTAEGLRSYAHRLRTHLERRLTTGTHPLPAPADVAYTLQTGRPALPFRLAAVAATLPELADQLRAHLEGPGPVPGLLVTGADGKDDREDREDRDDAGDGGQDGRAEAAEAEALARRGSPRWLASLWVRGRDVDWAAVHRAAPRRRVPLPAYPFAPDRYWLPEPPGGRTHQP